MTENNLTKGLITVIYKKQNWLNDLFFNTIVSQDIELKNKQNVIISYDSGEYITDIMDQTYNNLICNNIEFTSSWMHMFPLYFSNKNHTYFHYSKDEKSQIFEQFKLIYNDNILSETEKSLYNCIFYKTNYSINVRTNVLTIRKLKGGFDSNRYLFSYDRNEFNHDELLTILHYIFCVEK